MPRASCISHPEGERLILIRKWQLEACGKDACAAALLNLFEYWHNIKLEQNSQAKNYNEVALRHGDKSTQVETLMQWHTTEQLEASLLNIFNKRRIQGAIEMLESLKFISVHRNPNPRYAFDKTKHFLFYPAEVLSWLQNYFSNNHDSKLKNQEKEQIVPNANKKLNMVRNELIDSDDLHPSVSSNYTNDRYENDLQMKQNEQLIRPNCTKQYTKNTYQDYLPKLQKQKNIICEESNFSLAFGIFWDKWVEFTNKPINKKKSYEIFSSLMMKDVPSLLTTMLEALGKQREEKNLRLNLNLFVPQWPDPSSWLKEARWADEVFLDEEFYKAEILRANSGVLQNKQTIKQQREYYLDGQYKSDINKTQDERSGAIATRQDAIKQFNQEYRNRTRNL